MIELKNDRIEIERGNLYWYTFYDRLMPILIIQNNTGNKNSDNTIVIKLSSSENVSKKYPKIPTIVKIDKNDVLGKPDKLKHIKEVGYVLTSDIYTVKKNTVNHYIGKLTETAMHRVEEALKISLDI